MEYVQINDKSIQSIYWGHFECYKYDPHSFKAYLNEGLLVSHVECKLTELTYTGATLHCLHACPVNQHFPHGINEAVEQEEGTYSFRLTLRCLMQRTTTRATSTSKRPNTPPATPAFTARGMEELPAAVEHRHKHRRRRRRR